MRLRFVAAGPLVTLLLLSGCSAVQTPEPACRPLGVAELPLLGGIRGTWIDDERFVLADQLQSRLLVYDTSEGLERVVVGWESEDPNLSFQAPMAIQPWGNGFVLADFALPMPERLLQLDRRFRPVSVLWTSDIRRGEDGWEGDEVFNVFELAALGDRLYLQAARHSGNGSSEPVYAEFGTVARGQGRGDVLGQRVVWPGSFEERVFHSYPVRRLATAGGRDASVFALRYGETPFVQELVPDVRPLQAFPELPATVVTLPESTGPADTAYDSALAAASYPAGLYGDQAGLYVLVRDATGDAILWDLHRIDPERDDLVGKLRLPTSAPHLSLLPGRKYWVLEESDAFRKPMRLLLLSSAAMRAGEVPSCD